MFEDEDQSLVRMESSDDDFDFQHYDDGTSHDSDSISQDGPEEKTFAAGRQEVLKGLTSLPAVHQKKHRKRNRPADRKKDHDDPALRTSETGASVISSGGGVNRDDDSNNNEMLSLQQVEECVKVKKDKSRMCINLPGGRTVEVRSGVKNVVHVRSGTDFKEGLLSDPKRVKRMSRTGCAAYRAAAKTRRKPGP